MWRIKRLGALGGTLAVLMTLVVTQAGPVRAASLTEVTSFGSNPGSLRMFEYIPDNLPSNSPLMVAMHGCTQSAAAYDDAPGWTKYADLYKIAMIFPQQQSSNNQNSCFNWFSDFTRGQGEPLSIIQMVNYVQSHNSTDPHRVYAAGLSAGGAMTAVMLATYPDVFAGGAIFAGIPYGCATSLNDAFSCENPGKTMTAQQWGDKVRAASSWTGPWPKVTIMQGDKDSVVNPVNMTELVKQWTNVNGISQTPAVQDTVKGFPHKVYEDSNSKPLVELYTLTGMDHGQPIDVGSNTDQCGTAGAYILNVGLCGAYFADVFLGLNNTDTTPPTVSITAPANNANVSGSVTITASASDNVGVTKVEFYVDGKLLSTVTASPYQATWDSTTATNGSHTLTAKAYDAAGNSTT